jgi:hypothetical protein
VQHFKLQYEVKLFEVGREPGEETNEVVMSAAGTHLTLRGLNDRHTTLLAGHIFGKVRVTIEPVED